MKKTFNLSGLMIALICMLSVVVYGQDQTTSTDDNSQQYMLSKEDIAHFRTMGGRYVSCGASCGHGHHAHGDHGHTTLRSPNGGGGDWVHNPDPCAVKLNLLVIEGPNRGKDGARFPQQYEQLFKDSLNMYLTDMPHAVANADITPEEMPYVDKLFYIDYPLDIPSTINDEYLMKIGDPDPEKSENPFNKLVREEMALRASQGDTIHGIIFYDKYETGPVGGAMTKCDSENVLMVIIKTNIANPDDMTTEQVNKLSLRAAHELGHTLEGNHEKSLSGGITNQKTVCNSNNFSIFDNNLKAGCIMNSIFGIKNVVNAKKEFNSYWSPTNAEQILGVINKRNWYPRTADITMWLDADGDGEGDPDMSILVCDSIPGYVFNDSDPDDTDATITPVAETDIDQIKIYPNPTTGVVTVQGVNIKQIVVIDSRGHELSSTKEAHLDLSNYLAGIYTIQIQTDTKIISKKIIKLR